MTNASKATLDDPVRQRGSFAGDLLLSLVFVPGHGPWALRCGEARARTAIRFQRHPWWTATLGSILGLAFAYLFDEISNSGWGEPPFVGRGGSFPRALGLAVGMLFSCVPSALVHLCGRSQQLFDRLAVVTPYLLIWFAWWVAWFVKRGGPWVMPPAFAFAEVGAACGGLVLGLLLIRLPRVALEWLLVVSAASATWAFLAYCDFSKGMFEFTPPTEYWVSIAMVFVVLHSIVSARSKVLGLFLVTVVIALMGYSLHEGLPATAVRDNLLGLLLAMSPVIVLVPLMRAGARLTVVPREHQLFTDFEPVGRAP